jgi:hypothetical protein
VHSLSPRDSCDKEGIEDGVGGIDRKDDAFLDEMHFLRYSH